MHATHLLEKYPILALTAQQVKALWQAEQARKEAAGQPFYRTCIDPITGEVWFSYRKAGAK